MALMTSLAAHKIVTTVSGRPINVFSADTHHHVDRPIGTASVTLPLPLPEHMRGSDDRTLNTPVDIRAGFDDDVIRTIFSGRIDADSMVIDARERTATFDALGWATLLDWKEEVDLIFRGPIALHDIIRSLCRWRGVPSYRIDPIVDDSGAPILLGGNRDINEGRVKIPRRTSPLAWIAQKCRLFGYRSFDSGTEFRVQLVSGEPVADPVATFAEAVNAYRIARTRSLSQMVTYWTITGPTYPDADGVQVPIISFPEGVPPDSLLNPPGYRAGDESDNDLVTLQLAHTVRAAYERDRSLPYRELRWEARGDSRHSPGDVVQLTVPTMDVNARHWVMGVDHRFEVDEFTTSYGAWVGGTTALPAGDDARLVPVGTGPWHVGNEHLRHYAQPAPSGITVTVTFTVPDEYTSIAISGRGHGVNSFLIGGANTDSTVSKIEVWQNGEKVGTADMPVMPENLLARLPYAQDRHWQGFRMPVPGRLEAGPAELRIVSGVDAAGGPDDFEVKQLVAELRGVGRPDLPRQGVK